MKVHRSFQISIQLLTAVRSPCIGEINFLFSIPTQQLRQVPLKSSPYLYRNPFATSLALEHSTSSATRSTLKTHLHAMACLSGHSLVRFLCSPSHSCVLLLTFLLHLLSVQQLQLLPSVQFLPRITALFIDNNLVRQLRQGSSTTLMDHNQCLMGTTFLLCRIPCSFRKACVWCKKYSPPSSI